MINYPLVSVLMTAYNREKYIAEAIESVLASTFTNFEFIIVDDCSKDNTLAIVTEYEKKDERIKVHSNTQNLGQFINRNKAASLAIGKYLKYVDSDDMIKPQTLSIMVEGMERFKDAGIGIVYEDNSKIHFLNISYKVVNPNLAYLWHYCNGGMLFPGPTGCIYKKEKFLLQNGFPLDLGINGDIYLNLKIAATSQTVLFANELVFWRKHSGQVDELQQDYFKMHNERFLINQKILYDTAVPLNKRQLKNIRLSIKILYMRGAIINYLLKGQFNKFKNLLKVGKVPLYSLLLTILPLRILTPFKKNLTSIN